MIKKEINNKRANSMKLSLIGSIYFIFFLSTSAFSKVEPPNYDFSLNSFDLFKPDNSLAAVKKKYGKGETVFKYGNFITYKFYVAHLRYRFPILVQATGDEITDFYARLPAYFLHDIFHQSIINRIGKQDKYYKAEEQALYIWKNKKNLNYVYSGACSITCFPVYYAVYKNKYQYGSSYKPLIKKMEVEASKDEKK